MIRAKISFMPEKQSYFSIRSDLLPSDIPIPFSLYINSSSIKDREKFIRLTQPGEILKKTEVQSYQQKYHQLYVSENERGDYLKLMMSSKNNDVEKTNILKDSAITYLNDLFDKEKGLSPERLSQGIENCREVVSSMVDVLEHHEIDSLKKLIGELSFHDFYTFDHSINVSMYCIALYRMLKPKASRTDLIHIGLGGLLHDLGKIKISTSILNKPDGLTDEEYQEIKKHPDLGLDLLLSGHCEVDESLDVKILGRIINEHHENYDGTGYPKKIKGENIDYMARVCTVADFFDAITTKRSYSDVLPLAEAIGIMKKTSGKKIDPTIFSVFEKNIHLVKSDYTRELSMSDSFDPTLPYAKFPVTEKKKNIQGDFGKIVVKDVSKKKGS